MAASTGSPASRKSTKRTPLTTRPSFTSRQGMTRTLNMGRSYAISRAAASRWPRRRSTSDRAADDGASAGPQNLLRRGRLAADQRGISLDRLRPTEQEALRLVAGFAQEEIQLFLGFDPFRRDR